MGRRLVPALLAAVVLLLTFGVAGLASGASPATGPYMGPFREDGAAYDAATDVFSGGSYLGQQTDTNGSELRQHRAATSLLCQTLKGREGLELGSCWKCISISARDRCRAAAFDFVRLTPHCTQDDSVSKAGFFRLSPLTAGCIVRDTCALAGRPTTTPRSETPRPS